MKLIFCLTIFCLLGMQVSVQDSCHNQKLQDCVFILTEFAKENESPFPRNEEEINKQCLYLDNIRNCIYNYSILCMTELQTVLGDFLLSSTADKMKNICDKDHDLHKTYIKNAACIDEHYKGTAPCIKAILATVEILGDAKPENKLSTFCCAYLEFRSCLAKHFESVCNKEVVELIDTVIEFLISEVAIQTCNSYKEVGGKCPDLPTANDLKGTYKSSIFGSILEPFLRE